MKSKSYHLNEVRVEEKKAIPLAYKSDVFKEKPSVGHLLFQPISYFYYYFSQRERKKRNLLSIIEQEQLAEKYNNIIGKSHIAELTGLKGKELDQCVIYCNRHIILTLQDTEDTIKGKLLSAISAFYKSKKDDNNTEEKSVNTGEH